MLGFAVEGWCVSSKLNQHCDKEMDMQQNTAMATRQLFFCESGGCQKNARRANKTQPAQTSTLGGSCGGELWTLDDSSIGSESLLGSEMVQKPQPSGDNDAQNLFQVHFSSLSLHLLLLLFLLFCLVKCTLQSGAVLLICCI